MRCVVQRVSSASVTVEGKTVGSVGAGLMVLIGVSDTDTDTDLIYMAEKVPNLRIFDDENGVMNKSILDCGGSILAEQFPAGMLTLPVGGFLVLGCLIALMQWALSKSKK